MRFSRASPHEIARRQHSRLEAHTSPLGPAVAVALLIAAPPVGLAWRAGLASARSVIGLLAVAGVVILIAAVVAAQLARRWNGRPWAGLAVVGLGLIAALGYGWVASAAEQLGVGSVSGRRLVWLAAVSFTAVVVWAARRAPITAPVLAVLTIFAVAHADNGLGNPAEVTQRLDDQRAAALEQYYQPLADRPNIYFFVVDGFVRADQLEKFTGHTERRLENRLEQRGFVVSDSMRSNYPLTLLEVSSMLQLDYAATRPDDLTTGPDPYSDIMRGGNAVVDVLVANGYSYTHAEPGDYLLTRCPDPARGRTDSRCVKATRGAGLRLRDGHWSLLRATPFRDATDWLRARIAIETGYTEPEAVLGELNDVPTPFMLFAHIHQPHPPSRYNRDCSLHETSGGTAWRLDDTDAYLDELLCVSDQLTRTVDRILEDDPEAVIVIQSDHGSAFSISWADGIGVWGEDQYEERFAVFSGIRLPQRCRTQAEAITTQIHTFNVVLACLAGSEPSLVDDRFFVRTPKPFINLEEFDWAEIGSPG